MGVKRIPTHGHTMGLASPGGGMRFVRGSFGLAVLSLGMAGCGVRVSVDSRLNADSAAWTRLDGPSYRIVATDPQMEASLEFQEYADLVAAAIEDVRPELQRALKPPATPGVSEDIVFTLGFQVIDRGTAVYSYPIYGHSVSTIYTRRGAVYRGYSTGYAGQSVESVHLGFAHVATLSAWVPQRDQPAGRLVIWESTASLLSDDPDLRGVMPYLAVSLAEYYGRATDGRETVKFKRHDWRIERLSPRRHGDDSNE